MAKDKQQKPDKITVVAKPAADETTEIICIIDRSTSILTAGLVESTIEGYNAFIMEQRKAPGKAKVTTCLFDGDPNGGADTYQILHSGTDVQQAPFLDGNNYKPKGWTAMYDAIGITLQNVRERFSKEGKPDKVIVLIMTDGQNNVNIDFNKEKVLETIKELREKEKWGFVFIGANIDAFQEGGSIGVSKGSTLAYSNTRGGVKTAYKKMSSSVYSMRSMASHSEMFSASLDNLVNNDDLEEKDPSDDKGGK